MFAMRSGITRAVSVNYAAVPVSDDSFTYIDTYTGVTTATLQAHQVGDVFIAWASRDTSSNVPTLPSGWTQIAGTGANSLSFQLAYKVATTTGETSGAWTNATSLVIDHIRPKSGWAVSIGTTDTSASSSATLATFPAITLQNTNDTSCVLAYLAHRSADVTVTTPPTGMVLSDYTVDEFDAAASYRVAAPTSTWSQQTVQLNGTASAIRTYMLELKFSENIPVNLPTSFAVNVSGTQVTISWTDTNSGLAQHRIQVSVDNTNWSFLVVKNAGTNSHVISDVPAGTNYYRVRAEIGATVSAYTASDDAVVTTTDTTPTAFSFTDQTNVALSGVVTFDAITVQGINASAAITISGDASSQYSKNGGAFTSAAGTVVAGDTVQPRHNASASNSTPVNTVVTIGGVSDTATSTTLAASGGATYTPLKLMSFEGGTLEAEATGANGFETCMSNTLYSNAVSGPLGGSRVCKIQGLNQGGTVFGGLMVSPDVRPSAGSDCWVRMYHYFPAGFCFQNNANGDQWGQTKWIRFQFGAGGDRLTFQIGNYSASSCNTSGILWGATAEGDLGTANHEFPTQISIPRGGWRCLEWQVHFSTDSGVGYIRGWVDGEYCGQVTCKTMADSGNLTEIIYGDYINGGHILNNPWYIDEGIITFETPDATDSGSRPFIGTTRQTGDF